MQIELVDKSLGDLKAHTKPLEQDEITLQTAMASASMDELSVRPSDVRGAQRSSLFGSAGPGGLDEAGWQVGVCGCWACANAGWSQ